jgi:hypothetical protein
MSENGDAHRRDVRRLQSISRSGHRRRACATQHRAKPLASPAVESFRRLSRDLYIPTGGTGFWQGAIREPEDQMRAGIDEAITEGAPLLVDLLYGDYEGGQRTISRFSLARTDAEGWLAGVVGHWRLDGVSPRD